MLERPAPSDPFSLVGSLLERKYRVDRVVAEGGFGVVYSGHHIGLDVAVAVKVLRPQHGHDPDDWADGIAKFLLEAKAIAKIRHPAVVDVLDVGVTPVDRFPAGVPWIVLEWLEGETLQDHLARRRGGVGRSPEETLGLLRPVLEAIARAHELGITHRDLKPSNIMVMSGKDGQSVKVLDFGIAKLMGDEPATASGHTSTDTHGHAFSIVCAAPEQVSRTRTGPWTDVYALALLITEVLTDRAAYPEDDAAARYEAVFHTRRPTPAKSGVDVGAWEAVLERALALRPADRQPDAGDLLADLERTLKDARPGFGAADDSPAIDASTARERAAPRRSRAWALAAVALVAGVGSFYAWRVRAQRESPLIAAPAFACTTNRACIEREGRPAICNRSKGACAVLESTDCRVLADPRAIEKDDTVWFGAMLPATGPDADAFGRVESHALDLARRDFEEIMSPTADQRADDQARRFGVIACDDAVDPARAAAHLVDDIGVPAIVGFRSGVELMELSGRLLNPKGVLSVATLSTNPLVTQVPQGRGGARLVWRTTYNASRTASAVSAFVSDVVAKELGVDPLRVALIRPKNAMGAAYSDAVHRTLRSNGKSVSEDAGNFRDLSFDGDSDDNEQYARIVDQLLTFLPHVILFSGGRPVVLNTFPPLEEGWPKTSAKRPSYVNFALIGANLLEFVGTDASRRHRVFGVWPVSTTEANTRFVARYREIFPEDNVARTNAPSTTYDSFYLLAYATYAVPPGEPVTGAVLSRAFARLVPPGRKVEVGLGGIFDAYGELTAGRNVDLVGATGPLDFDLATGEAEVDQAIMCVSFDAAGRAASGVESGLVYSAVAHKLAGKMKCP